MAEGSGVGFAVVFDAGLFFLLDSEPFFLLDSGLLAEGCLMSLDSVIVFPKTRRGLVS